MLFVFIALFSWGFGDFFIQRSTRKFGDWIALFYITAFESVILLPFVYREIGTLFLNSRGLIILLLASGFTLFAALFEFEAFRIGKISLIEPINALEVPVTIGLAAGLGILFNKEQLKSHQWVGFVLAFVSVILLAGTTSR